MNDPIKPILEALLGLLSAVLMVGTSCLSSGCQSSAKFTPEQQQSIANTFSALNKAANEAGVSATAFVQIGRPGFYASQEFGVAGVEGWIVAHANPAAAKQTPPLKLIQTPNGLMAVPELPQAEATQIPAAMTERWEAVAEDLRVLLDRVAVLEAQTPNP